MRRAAPLGCVALLLAAPAHATNYSGLGAMFGSFVGGFCLALTLSFGRWAVDNRGSWSGTLFALSAAIFGLATGICALVASLDALPATFLRPGEASGAAALLSNILMGAGLGFLLTVPAWWLAKQFMRKRLDPGAPVEPSVESGFWTRLGTLVFFTLLACFAAFVLGIIVLLMR